MNKANVIYEDTYPQAETPKFFQLDVTTLVSQDGNRTVINVPVVEYALDFPIFTEEFWQFAREKKLGDATIEAIHDAMHSTICMGQVTNWLIKNTTGALK